MYTYLFHTQLHDYNIIYNIKTKNMQEAELLLELIAAILGHPVACFLASTRCSLVSSCSLHARAIHSLARMSPTLASASAMPANFNLCPRIRKSLAR